MCLAYSVISLFTHSLVMLHVFYIYMNVNIYMFSFVTVSSVLMGLSICWYCCSVAQSCLTMWRHGVTVCQASPSFIISLSLFKLVFFESVMPSDQLILCRPLLLLPSVFSSIRVFSGESCLRVRRPKYWSFSFSFSPSNEYSGLVSFRIDWFDLLAVQGTLKSSPAPHFEIINSF